jgi:serine/threonine protein kinase
LIDADLTAAQPWLATEFVDGPTLSEYVRTHGCLRGASLTALAVALLEALAAIQAAGVVHRDLTPNNVILASDGPKVVDFGIAHHVDASSAITQTGTTLGTPAWMSPEKAEGRTAAPPKDAPNKSSSAASSATSPENFFPHINDVITPTVHEPTPTDHQIAVTTRGASHLALGCWAKSV